jgi:hypothetical protein
VPPGPKRFANTNAAREPPDVAQQIAYFEPPFLVAIVQQQPAAAVLRTVTPVRHERVEIDAKAACSA